MSAAIVPMSLADQLNQLERYFFFQRDIGEASGRGYIASNTWRGFRSEPKTARAISTSLTSAFDFLTPPFDSFIQDHGDLSRSTFDAFHAQQVDDLYAYLQTPRSGAVVFAGAEGDFHGRAYNPYAKIVNLAHTHWCFRRNPRTG